MWKFVEVAANIPDGIVDFNNVEDVDNTNYVENMIEH